MRCRCQADADSRVHTTFQSAATATGRLSSINPNLQNIPIRTELGREIRAAFIAAPGTQLLSADYSQIELRLLAHFSGDPLLVRAYQQTMKTFIPSPPAKSSAFPPTPWTRKHATAPRPSISASSTAFRHSASPPNLAFLRPRLALTSIATSPATQGVKAFIEKTLETARREGAVRTMFGRMRPIPDIESRNPNPRGFAERTAINTPLQGTAADLIKLAMITLDRKITERKLEDAHGPAGPRRTCSSRCRPKSVRWLNS